MVQTSIKVRQQRLAFTRFGLSQFKTDIVEVSFNQSAQQVAISGQNWLDSREWVSVSLIDARMVQISTSSGACRLLSRGVNSSYS